MFQVPEEGPESVVGVQRSPVKLVTEDVTAELAAVQRSPPKLVTESGDGVEEMPPPLPNEPFPVPPPLPQGPPPPSPNVSSFYDTVEVEYVYNNVFCLTQIKLIGYICLYSHTHFYDNSI